MNMTNSCGNLHFTLALCGLAITFATLKTWGEILASFESTTFFFLQPPQGCAAMVPAEFSGIICLIAVNTAIWTYPLPHGITNEYLIFPPRIIRCYSMWWYHKIFRLSPCSCQSQQQRISDLRRIGARPETRTCLQRQLWEYIGPLRDHGGITEARVLGAVWYRGTELSFMQPCTDSVLSCH